MSLRLLLRDRRIELGLTTTEVAEKARAASAGLKGFHGSSISYWETPSSGRSPSTEQLVAWAEVLGLSIELKLIRRARAA
jgi:transcriptional regulator with XRE-family HTH domain